MESVSHGIPVTLDSSTSSSTFLGPWSLHEATQENLPISGSADFFFFHFFLQLEFPLLWNLTYLQVPEVRIWPLGPFWLSHSSLYSFTFRSPPPLYWVNSSPHCKSLSRSSSGANSVLFYQDRASHMNQHLGVVTQ